MELAFGALGRSLLEEVEGKAGLASTRLWMLNASNMSMRRKKWGFIWWHVVFGDGGGCLFLMKLDNRKYKKQKVLRI